MDWRSQRKQYLYKQLDKNYQLINELEESGKNRIEGDELRKKITDLKQKNSKWEGELISLLDAIKLNSLYTSWGFKSPARGREEIFQDFNINHKGHNVNAVSYLWADTYAGNEINAAVKKPEGEEAFLRITFNIQDNERNDFGCNLAIRPQDEQPLENRPPNNKKYLLLDARIPQENETQEDENLKEIGLAFRVINGCMQHWEYANHHGQYKQQKIEHSNVWETVKLDLVEPKVWQLFDADGCTFKVFDADGKIVINFDVISSVVIKVGSYTGLGELGPGKGIIDIKRLRLSNNPY